MKTIFLKGLCGLSLAMIPEAVLASSANNLKSISPHQYTHLIETYQSQIFEPLSQTALFLEQSASENTYKTAGVYFITNSKGQVFSSIGNESNNTFDDPTGEYCARNGFEVTSCASGLFNKACPYNDKIYDKCCDESYKYTKSQCSAPKKLSSDTCGDKYQCYCDTSTYPYTSCAELQIKGSACTDDSGTHYSSCICPPSVPVPYGCEVYYDTPCNKGCQKAYADNCRNQESVQTPYGCEKYFDDCDSKCEKAYTDNCRNRTAVSAPYGCEQYYADCQSKCEVAYTDNCHNRTAVDSSAFGCQKYFADCPSKCEKAYEDNCHNQVAVIEACPKGATCKYFADCSSKIQEWTCTTCMEKSGNVCRFTYPVLYGDGTVSKDFFSDKRPIGTILDENKRLAVALDEIKGDGTLGSSLLAWAGIKNCQITTMSNCSSENCDVDGRTNTNRILAYGSNCGGVPAATACNLFEPEGCIASFCKKGKWFLPSLQEGLMMHTNYNQINCPIRALGYLGFLGSSVDGTYWSSTQSARSTAKAYTTGGSFYTFVKEEKSLVRPIVKY